MSQETTALLEKKARTSLASGLAQHAAVRSSPERDLSPVAQMGSSFAHDLSQVPAHAAPGAQAGAERTPACPLSPRTCPFGGACHTCPAQVQRRATSPAEPTTVPPIVHEVLSSPGQPLDAETRAFMEPHFGHDFSQVRVHADAKAAESAQAVKALAYTVGRDVVFGTGQYVPGTSAGQRLMAHELTHVMQQKSLQISPSESIGVTSDDRLESEAVAAANSDQAAPIVGLRQIHTPSIQCQDAGGGGAAAAAPASHRFSAEGVAVVVRASCAPAVYGFANVEDATRTALDAIFNADCIEESRRTRMQKNLTAHGLDIRCRRSAKADEPCAQSIGYNIPANIFALGSSSFTGHPDSDPVCQPLESTILHEIVHLTRGFFPESLPSSCEASCFGVGGGNPELCRDIDVFGRRRAP